MKLVYVGNGLSAAVDNEDYFAVCQLSWGVIVTKSATYAINREHNIRMHDMILPTEDGMEVDHIDHDGLNNQKDNLRPATKAQQQQNRRKQRGSSLYKGVCWRQRCNRWVAQIQVDRHRIHIGHFTDEIEAAKAYDRYAVDNFGEFALTNEMLGLLDSPINE